MRSVLWIVVIFGVLSACTDGQAMNSSPTVLGGSMSQSEASLPVDGAVNDVQDSSDVAVQVGQVDPQIESDVAALFLPSPGTQMRAIRLGNAVGNIQDESCGISTTRTPLDDTGNRLDQAYYADVELIRTKGLAEIPIGLEHEESSGSDAVNSGVCSVEALPSLQRVVSGLGGAWADETLRVVGEPHVAEAAHEAADCLSRQSGFDLGSSDRIAAYLNAVDYVLSGTDTDEMYLDQMGVYSVIFADCTTMYFQQIEMELSIARPDFVERNREMVSALASELAEAGYVP